MAFIVGDCFQIFNIDSKNSFIASIASIPVNFFFLIFCFLLSAVFVRAEEPLPSSPKNYFNDEAGIVSPAVAQQLNEQLAEFDRATSNQIVVAIYPKFLSKSSIDEYAQRLYSAWHPGTKKNSNGALLLVFPAEHQLWIQTGYGLEGALPDALCKRIIDDLIVPQFQKGNYDQGLIAGVTAMMKATAGEYQGSARTMKKPFSWMRLLFSPLGFFLLMMIGSFLLNWRQRRMGGGGGGWFIGGGGFGGGGDSGGDWGGFSGGGGDSGGGGAGGSW